MPVYRKFYQVVIVLIITFQSNISLAQYHYSRHFTINDGLPSNFVRAIFKDSRGVLWIGTDAGLCTFDGTKFSRFTLLSENSSNKVWAITEDDEGNLWFGTYGSGLFKYDGEKLINYKKPTIPSLYIRTLKYSSKHKCLLIGTEHGFCSYKDSRFKSFFVDSKHTDQRVSVMGFLETEKGIIYYTYQHYGYSYFPLKDSVVPISLSSSMNSKSSSTCFISSTGDTIVGVNKTGMKVISKHGVIEYCGMGQVFDIKEDRHGNIWCAAWSYTEMVEKGGLFILNRKGKLECVNNRFRISDKLALCIHIDNENGNIYLGTDGNGFYLIPNNGITYYDSKYFGVNKLDIFDILLVDNTFWISAGSKVIVGTPKNVFRVYDETYFIQNSTSGYWADPKTKKPSIAKKFKCIISDENKNVWIGSDVGLFRVKANKVSFNFFDYYDVNYDNFLIDKKGLTLCGGWGLFFSIPNIYEKNKFQFYTTKVYPLDINRMVTRNDEIWFSSDYFGLYRYKDGKYKSYAQADTLLPVNLKDICIDRKGNLILGDNNGKIFILEGSDSLRIKYELSEKDGIVGNSIVWLFCNRSNILWVGTNTGLNVFSLDELYEKGKPVIRYYNADEGYTEMIVRRVVEDKEGNIWLGGGDNLVQIDPDKLFALSQTSSQLLMTAIDINNQKFDWSKISSVNRWTRLPQERITLKHDKNSFIFKFEATNRFNPSKDMYSVYLEGFDKDTSGWSVRQEATYTNLPPDDYKLTIKGKNISSQQMYKPAVFTFSIKNPWWKTWWFYSGLVMSFFLLGYLVFKNRLKHASEKSRIEQRISELRLESLKSQMNPHFIFNVFSAIQYYILQKDTKNALVYMGLFAKLVRKTLENSTKKRITLEEEVSFLNDYLTLEQKRISNFKYHIKVSPLLDLNYTMIPPMLVQPLVENAIMHGVRHLEKEGRITVEFIKDDIDKLRCIVEDNGIGREKSKEIYSKQGKTHNSKGTEITEERIRLLNSSNSEANIQLLYTDLCENGKVTGTRVELLIGL